ncbi:MAG TPA: hypothetical protein VGG73_13855 [Vicinamibacterales bacterium]
MKPPLAMIARISREASEVAHFTFDLDGSPICEKSLGSARSVRLDCAIVTLGSAENHVLTIEGPSSPWELSYLELSTHHGSTSGDNFLVVFPSRSQNYIRPNLLAVASAWILLALAFAVPVLVRWRPLVHALHRGCVVVIGTLLTLIAVSSLVSAYDVALALRTFVLWFAVLLAPRLWTAVKVLRHGLYVANTTHRRIVVVTSAVLVALVVGAAYDAVVQARLRDFYDGNYSGLLFISREAFDRNPLLGSRDDIRKSLVLRDVGAYDGQFMYFATFDPLLRVFRDQPAKYREVMDAAPYRFGRIGYAALTLIFSGGHWQRYPITMIGLIIAALGVLTFELSVMAADRGLNPAYGLIVLMIPGFWLSLQSGLPEPIAAAALVGAVWCLSCQRLFGAAILFAVSLLVRETGGIAMVCGIAAAIQGGTSARRVVWVGVFAVVVVLAWRLYVASVLYPDWGAEGLLFHPPDLTVPFSGFLDLWKHIHQGLYYPDVPDMSRAGLNYPILLIAGLCLAITTAIVVRDPMAFGAVLYGVIAVSLNYGSIWVHVANGQRGTFELFVTLALCTLSYKKYPRSLKAVSWLFWCGAALYVFGLSHDALYVRAAMSSPF